MKVLTFYTALTNKLKKGWQDPYWITLQRGKQHQVEKNGEEIDEGGVGKIWSDIQIWIFCKLAWFAYIEL